MSAGSISCALLLGCANSSLPTLREVMSQVEFALLAKPASSMTSIVADYLPCTPYQEIEELKFLGVISRAPTWARASVEITYQYTVSSIDMKNDLAAGRRALHYGRVSCSEGDSKEWLTAHYFEKGTQFVVDGLFDFEKTNKGWQLRERDQSPQTPRQLDEHNPAGLKMTTSRIEPQPK